MTGLKKCLSLIVTLAIAFSVFTGCGHASGGYKVTRLYEDGHVYLEVSPATEKIGDGGARYTQFDSMDDFYRTFKVLDFDASGFSDLRFFAGDDGKLEILDPDHLYTPAFPVETKTEIGWMGDRYFFDLDFGTEHENTGGDVAVYPPYYKHEMHINYALSRCYVDYRDPFEKLPCRSWEETIDGHTVKGYLYEGDKRYQIIQYEQHDGEKSLYLSIRYTLHDDSLPENTLAWENPEIYPEEVLFYGELGDAAYEGRIFDFDFGPDLDWLLSFAFERYVPPQELASLELVNEKTFPGEKVRAEEEAAREAKYGNGE